MASDDTYHVEDVAPATADLHAVLASGHRRTVLRFLRDREGSTATLDEVAANLVDRDGEVDDHDEARVVLHHVALPKLAETGAIDYDPRSGRTRYYGGSHLEALLPEYPVA